jgi:putative transposase
MRLRTTNGLERINREIKRRTRVASIFPNTALLPAPCLRASGRMRRGMDDRENLSQPE